MTTFAYRSFCIFISLSQFLMAYNQIFNQTQAMASLPLITDSQADQQQQQLDHVNALPHPNNQAATPHIPNLSSSSTDLLSMEFSQLSLELNNQRANMEEYLHFQYLQAANAVMTQQTNHDMLVQGYVSRVLDSIQEKEQELLATKQTKLELEKCIMDFDSKLKGVQKIAVEKEAMVTILNQQLQKFQESHQMRMTTNESDADSSCGDNLSSKDIIDRYCQMCRTEVSSVIILPCKHLCCCKGCEAYVYSCPVCSIRKDDCIEVSWPPWKKQGTDH